MKTSGETAMTRRSLGAGIGALAFGAMTLVATFLADTPGGGYARSQVVTYLSHGDRVSQLLAFFLAVCAIPGLILALAHIRDAVASDPERRLAASLVWGSGIAAAACFAVGWGIDGGQLFAHIEGGAPIVIPAPMTYLLSEVGVVLVFGSGAMLLGFALITLVVSSRGLLPTWLRSLTLVFGLCGVAGLAWATYFVLLFGMAVIGVWLIAAGRPGVARVAAQART
jgi:hypothetical protein